MNVESFAVESLEISEEVDREMDSYKNLADDNWSDGDTTTIARKSTARTWRSKRHSHSKLPTDNLLSFKEPLRWHLLGLFLYSLLILALLIWVYTGEPYDHRSRRVLRVHEIKNLKVDQFYSNIASVALFVPAAVLVGQICLEFGLLHPFSIAHRTSVTAADLDRMIDTGPLSLLTIWKYSPARATMIASIMLIGTALVPVSSLLLSVGLYAPQTRHEGVVGLPALNPASSLLRMSSTMGYTGPGPFVPTYDDKDFVLQMISDTHKGTLVSRRGGLDIAKEEQGPISTINITFSPGVRYDSVVTLKWVSGCEAATDEISYSTTLIDNKPVVTFTWPDGSSNTTTPGHMPIFMWTASSKTASGIPLGGTTYLAQASLFPDYNASASSAADGITVSNHSDLYVSRVKCSPRLTWQVSSCIAGTNSMKNCTAAPGTNTTALDTVALDALTGYMTAVPWMFYLRNDYTFRMTLQPFYVMPTTQHYARILGTLAESIAAVSTAGYFGTATVPAVGEQPRAVYLVRVYVLWILLGLVCIVLGLSAADVVYSRVKRLPFRKATFLTIAYAVHGRGVDWDEGCGCVMGRGELRRRNGMGLRYGVDVKDRLHVGFAGDVRGWGEDDEEKEGRREEEGRWI